MIYILGHINDEDREGDISFFHVLDTNKKVFGRNLSRQQLSVAVPQPDYVVH